MGADIACVGTPVQSPDIRARDRVLFLAARDAEARAEALMTPAQVADAEARMSPYATTRGPRQEALRRVARATEPRGARKACSAPPPPATAAAWFAAADTACWTVVQHYEGMIRMSSRRHARFWRGKEDALLQELRIGWFEAALRFDPDRGIAFSTLAIQYGHSRVQHAPERQTTVRQGETRGLRTGGGWQTVPMVGLAGIDETAAAASPEDAVAAAQIRARLRVLDSREQYVVVARSQECSLKDLGTEMGLSKERVRQIERQAKITLRAAFAVR